MKKEEIMKIIRIDKNTKGVIIVLDKEIYPSKRAIDEFTFKLRQIRDYHFPHVKFVVLSGVKEIIEV